MTTKWIMDVLADMRSFAQINDLPRLAEALDDTALIAVAELQDRAVAPPRPADARPG